MPAPGKPVFATYFPRCQNVHLTKDVGLIPYIMHRDYGYRSYIICYDEDDFTQLKGLKGLEMLFMAKRKSKFIDGLIPPMIPKSLAGKAWFWLVDKVSVLFTTLHALPVMIRHGKEIDILQVYHLEYDSLVIGLIYRLVNRNGLLYLKLDTDPGIIDYYRNNPDKLKSKFHLHYLLFNLLSFDIISVESKMLFNFLLTEHPLYKRHSDRMFYLPNGLDLETLDGNGENSQKEDIIVHVSRMGSYQKGSDMAIQAFANVAGEFPGWKLILIGSMDAAFKKYYDDFMAKNPLLAGRIIYAGFISRDDVLNYYRKAKIALITSRWESFSMAGMEAEAFGDVLVCSDIPSMRDLTDGGRLGYLCPVEHIECYVKKLKIAMSSGTNERSGQASQFVRETYNFKNICGTLDGIIKTKLAVRNAR